jgi:ribosomal protein L11 methyltransferase
MKLATSIRSVAADNCDLILSGLLARDVNAILSAYRTQGFRLTRRIDLEGWVSLNMKRGR